MSRSTCHTDLVRHAWLLIVLAGCPSNNDGYGSSCELDSECSGGDLCARNGECDPPSRLRSVRTTWTINGQQPTLTTCASFPSFELDYYADPYGNDVFGYAPVPCMQGSFFIDKLPTRYTTVAIGSNAFSRAGLISADGTVSFDLQP